MEGLRHRGRGTPSIDLGGIWNGTLHVRNLGEFLVPPKSVDETEWIPQAGLLSHMGNVAGMPRATNTLQCSCGKCHQYMIGHESGGLEGVS